MNGGSSLPSWYYAKAGAPAGQQAGPFAWEQLVSLTQAGAIAPADLVWDPSLPQWLPAAQIQGLLPVAPSGAPYQPYPGQPAPAAKSGGRSRLAWVIPWQPW